MANKLAACATDFLLASLDLVGVTTLTQSILPSLGALMEAQLIVIQQQIAAIDIVYQIAVLPIQLGTQLTLNTQQVIRQIPLNRYRSCPPINDLMGGLETTLGNTASKTATMEYKIQQLTSVRGYLQKTFDNLQNSIKTIQSWIKGLNAAIAGIEAQGISPDSEAGKAYIKEQLKNMNFTI